MAERTVQELGAEIKRLADDWARECAFNALTGDETPRFSSAIAPLHNAIDALTSRLSAAEAKIAEVEKDAERYRWLCSHSIIPAPSLWESGVAFAATAIKRTAYKMDKQALDAAIDAAMQQGADK